MIWKLFRGRTSRLRFWLYPLIAIPLLILLYIVFYVYAMSFPGAYENGGPTPWPSDPLEIALAIVWALVLAAILIAGLAVAVKRLHDRNKAWWWLLIFLLPNSLSGYAQYRAVTDPGDQAGQIAFVSMCVALVFLVWALVELGFLRGTVGDNRYGLDPLAHNKKGGSL